LLLSKQISFPVLISLIEGVEQFIYQRKEKAKGETLQVIAIILQRLAFFILNAHFSLKMFLK
jgi:hypothetical protein